MSPRLALVLLAALGCGRAQRVDEDGGGAALMRNALLAGVLDVIVPTGAAEERCALLTAETRGPGEPRVFVRHSVGESPADHPRVVIGTPADPVAGHLARALGVDRSGRTGFRVLEQTFELEDDVLIATWQDPDRPGLPVTLHLGNDLERLALLVEAPLWAWKPNLRVLRAGECVLEVPLTVDGSIVRERLARPARARALLRQAYTALPPDPAAFTGLRAPDVGDERARAYFLACARAAMQSALWAAPGASPEPGALVLHADVEDFAAWTGQREIAWANPGTGIVHALLAPGVADDGGAAVALATVTRYLGPCAEPWLASGAAVYGAQHWHGRGLGAWCGRLARAGAQLPLETLLDPMSARRHSPHVLAPLRAELVGLLLQRRGDAYVRQLWSGTRRLVADAELDTAFRERVAARAAEPAGEEATSVERLRTPRALSGIVLCQPPFPQDRGFGTAHSAASLARARELGAQAVAVQSTLARELDPPARAGPGGGLAYGPRESDAALLSVLAQARSTGASVALLPQLLSAPGGSWSGSWLRNGETDWRTYFGEYRRFVQHYALLAELAGADVLSLGGGLMETTRLTVEGRRGSGEELAWKSAGWSGVIRAARGLFRGRLTFLAGSGEEADKIDFWKELDLIGLEPRIGYRPVRGQELHESRAVFLSVLQAAWQTGERLAHEHQRPLFVGPVSFPATPSPDDARLGPGASSERLRTEAFERVLQLAGRSRVVLDGVYFGRWSTELGDPGFGPRDHVLMPERARALMPGER